jgi:hypothetical protein
VSECVFCWILCSSSLACGLFLLICVFSCTFTQKKERLPTKMAGQLVRAVPVVQSGSESDDDAVDEGHDAQEDSQEDEEDVYVSDDDENMEEDGDERGGKRGDFADVDEDYGEDEDQEVTDASRHTKNRSSVLAAAAAAELELDPEARRAARATRVATVKLRLAAVAEAVLEDPENNVPFHQCDAGSLCSLWLV